MDSYLEGKFLGTSACARHAVAHISADGSMTFLTGGTGDERSRRCALIDVRATGINCGEPKS